MFNINYSVLNFSLEFQVDCNIVENKTSALRGILGETLAISNCLYDVNNRECEKCFLNEKCMGNSILNAKLKNKPYFLSEEYISPLIIECDNYNTKFLANDRLNFTLIILGDISAYIPYIIKAYELGGMVKGIQGNVFTVNTVRNEFGEILFDGEYLFKDKIVISYLDEYIKARKRMIRGVKGIKLITPLRYKQKGRFVDDIDEKLLMDLICRRIITVNSLQSNASEVVKLENNIKFKNKEISWSERERYSNRQKQKMTMGGIVGVIELEKIEEELIDYIIAGELLHIGKSTVFGLGQYLIF